MKCLLIVFSSFFFSCPSDNDSCFFTCLNQFSSWLFGFCYVHPHNSCLPVIILDDSHWIFHFFLSFSNLLTIYHVVSRLVKGVELGGRCYKTAKNMTDNKASKKGGSEGKRCKCPRDYFKGRFGDADSGLFEINNKQFGSISYSINTPSSGSCYSWAES